MDTKCIIQKRKQITITFTIPAGENAVKKDLNSPVLRRIVLFITGRIEPDVEIVYFHSL